MTKFNLKDPLVGHEIVICCAKLSITGWNAHLPNSSPVTPNISALYGQSESGTVRQEWKKMNHCFQTILFQMKFPINAV